ncbi:MAG TPA: hypothetical protein VN253_04300 [Kofleriaceae bacterium]|nr:hypothetical protein [Kofleriaceae bacterium]
MKIVSGMGLLVLAAVLACGKVEAPNDAPRTDGSGGTVDAAPDGPAKVCSFVTIAVCDTGVTIRNFCPAGQTVRQLKRCDGTTIMPPNDAYLDFHLCNCTFASCNCQGVAYDAIECCQ